MVRVIERQLYKINHYSSSEFVEADSLDDLARYVARKDAEGQTCGTVTEINLDGSHPRVAVVGLAAYQKEMKLLRTKKEQLRKKLTPKER